MADIQKFYYHKELAEQARDRMAGLRNQAKAAEEEWQTELAKMTAQCEHNYERSGSFELVCSVCGDTTES